MSIRALTLDDLIQLRSMLTCYEEALEWADSAEDYRIQKWIHRIDDGIAETQKMILLAAVEATGGWRE